MILKLRGFKIIRDRFAPPTSYADTRDKGSSFLKNKINRQHKEKESYSVIDTERFSFEEDQ